MQKEAIRKAATGDTDAPAVWAPGRIAEQVRRLEGYRQVKAIFVSPAPRLQQVRINALTDGKQLLMPSASLHDGFWGMAPYSVPFAGLAHAVSMKGMAASGQPLDLASLAAQRVGMLVTDALAADGAGVMVGDGKGFFDLAVALLQQGGALEQGFSVVTVTEKFFAGEYLEDHQPWDIRADVVIHPAGIEMLRPQRPTPAICWDALPFTRIRRITPLWQLHQHRADGK